MGSPESFLYLASRSARRGELLRQIGVGFEVVLLREAPDRARDVDETPLPEEPPVDYVRRVAKAKAQVAWMRLGDRRLAQVPVLAADTTVTVDGAILGKPTTPAEAAEFLRRLSGRAHEVLTAVVLRTGERTQEALSRSSVEFRTLDEQEIRRYVATGECTDKAGAYAIQGRAALFVNRIEGSFSGVVGLPLFETGQMLKALGRFPL